MVRVQLKELVSHAEHVPAHVVEGVARLADLIIARPSSSSSSPGSPPSAEEQSPGDLLTSLWDRRELAVRTTRATPLRPLAGLLPV